MLNVKHFYCIGYKLVVSLFQALTFFSLLMIAEVTLFFQESDLDMGIGLSLTVMLVMYTMYQSINDSIPKTAYLKFIDIWIGCCLFIPFIVFFIQVSML